MSVNSDTVLAVLDQIATYRDQKVKFQLLGQALQHPLFERIIVAALNPFLTYGIQKVPTLDAGWKREKTFDETTFSILDMLASRKLTGGAAQETVCREMSMLTEQSAELLRRVLIKDLRAGFSEITVNKIKPGVIPVYTCMRGQDFELNKYLRLCKKYRQAPWPVRCEIKYDGLRSQTIVNLGGSSVDSQSVSRNGLPQTSLSPYQEELQEFASLAQQLVFPEVETFVVDKEALSGGGESFNKTSSDVRKKSAASGLQLRVIDVLPWNQFIGKEESDRYEDRLLRLQGLVEQHHARRRESAIRLCETFIAESYEHLQELLNKVVIAGGEGLMLKPDFGIYEPKKSPFWLKLKGEFEVDVEVIDWYEGQDQFEGMLGGFIVDHRGVDVRVGGGFSPQERAQYWADITNKAVPFTAVDPETKEQYEVVCGPSGKKVKGMIIAAKHYGVTEAGSLRHPNFLKERPDLRPEEVEGRKFE